MSYFYTWKKQDIALETPDSHSLKMASTHVTCFNITGLNHEVLNEFLSH